MIQFGNRLDAVHPGLEAGNGFRNPLLTQLARRQNDLSNSLQSGCVEWLLPALAGQFNRNSGARNRPDRLLQEPAA
jgi:hypothetical protein